MNLFTKRNALIGWIVMRIARRKLDKKLNALVGKPARRRTLAAGLGLAAVAATTVAVLARRERPAASTT